MSNTANELTQKAREIFLQETRDLLALTKNGANDVFKRISASLALSTEAQQDVLLYLDIIDQRGHAGEQARDDFRLSMYVAICKAYLRVQRNGMIQYVSRLTPEAAEQLENIEIMAGERAPLAVAPPPPPAKTAAELLTEEVLRDWKFLPVDKVKHKMNNKAYKAEFDRLDAANLLETQITSLQDHRL